MFCKWLDFWIDIFVLHLFGPLFGLPFFFLFFLQSLPFLSSFFFFFCWPYFVVEWLLFSQADTFVHIHNICLLWMDTQHNTIHKSCGILFLYRLYLIAHCPLPIDFALYKFSIKNHHFPPFCGIRNWYWYCSASIVYTCDIWSKHTAHKSMITSIWSPLPLIINETGPKNQPRKE